MARTAGQSRHHRKLFTNPPAIGLSRLLATYEVGQLVTILYNSAFHKGRPHPRYHGRIGVIISQSGRQCYVVRAVNKLHNLHVAHIKPHEY